MSPSPSRPGRGSGPVALALLCCALFGIGGLNTSCGGGGGSSAASTAVTPVAEAPQISAQPAGLSLTAGASASFSVTASGSGTLHYQWYKDSTAVGTDSASYTIAAIQSTDAGSYTVVVRNDTGSVTSSAATLTVYPVVAASTNLAQGRTTSASSLGSATAGPGLVVDGNASTAWSSSAVDPSWILVDLGAAKAINRVVLEWAADYGKAYTIDVSSNSSTWTTVYTQTAGAGGVEDLTFPDTTARYVRMYGTARATSNGYALCEFQVYEAASVIISASAGSHGSISPAGATTVKQGTSQTFSITPDTGYAVAGVLVDGVSVGAVASYTFKDIQAYHSISASFSYVVTYAITASAGANGGISPSGAVTVVGGASQVFAITPATGYTVKSVLVDGASVGAVTSYTFKNVQAAHSISASFGTPSSYVLTASSDANGSISPSGAVTVTQGTSQTFTMTPNSGYTVESVRVDGVGVGSMSRYTFSNLQAAHTIAVTYAVSGGLVWNDEFDGSSIDTGKWAFDLGNGPTSPTPLYGWGNGEMEYYTSSLDNADIEDGSLVITARRQTWGAEPFTSARLVTRGKYSFNHGRFEARIKMPAGNRMWPAFWLLGDVGETWPKSGEIDIAEMFCGSAGRGDNVEFATAHWWDESTSVHLQDSAIWTNSTNLSDDYHVYQLLWDDQTLSGWIDGTQFWTLDISPATLAELRDHYFYLILNLAVGSPDFGMTSADQANGVLPQKMYVDYVRVYSNTGSTVQDEAAVQPQGTLGILADGTSCDNQLVQGTDANLYLWNNLTSATGTPSAGSTSVAVKTTDNTWFGFGYNATKRRNLLNYAAGYLHVAIKTTSTDTFKIGISGGNDGDAWVAFSNGSDPFGFKRDGQWHSVAIPMTQLSNADFTDIVQFFMVEGIDTVTPGSVFEFDEIYWSPNADENLATPSGTKFGIYTDRVCDAGSFDAASDGAINVWNKDNFTLASGVPFEGSNSFAFTAAAAAWYGIGIAPTRLYNLSAFRNGHLHVALKVPASTTSNFKLGVKSPGGTAVRESWIKFINGSDPYGMVRDGKYHELLVPVADFCNSDFAAISQLFMLSGDGSAAMEFDDVYLTAD